MSSRTMVKCDLCGKEINIEDSYFNIQHLPKETKLFVRSQDGSKFMDICLSCIDKIIGVSERKIND